MGSNRIEITEVQGGYDVRIRGAKRFEGRESTIAGLMARIQVQLEKWKLSAWLAEEPTPIEKMLVTAMEDITSADTISRSTRIALAAIAKAGEMAADRGDGHET